MAQIAQYESSDSEAPEEESFSVAQKQTLAKNAQLRKTLDKSNRVEKQKRRDRDAKFKTQKKQLLSEILADLPNIESEQEDEPPKTRVKVVQHKVKKLEAEKDGFKLKVLKQTKTALPPASSTLLNRKERFLNRKRH